MSRVHPSQHQRARVLRGIANQLATDPNYYTPAITKAVTQLTDAMLHRTAELRGRLPAPPPPALADPPQPT